MGQGKFNEAKAYFERAIQITRQLSGEEHPDIATCFANLAILSGMQGSLRDARHFLGQALAIRTSIYGPEHSETIALHMIKEQLM